MYSHRLLSGMPTLATSSSVILPLADCSVRAGFPSPAGDFAVTRLDIAEMLVQHPQATFLLRVAGPSMREYGIDDGDVIVVDRALRARNGSIVVAIIDSEFTVKALHTANGIFKLKAGNPTYPDIIPKDSQELEIWGVVTNCIKRFT